MLITKVSPSLEIADLCCNMCIPKILALHKQNQIDVKRTKIYSCNNNHRNEWNGVDGIHLHIQWVKRGRSEAVRA